MEHNFRKKVKWFGLKFGFEEKIQKIRLTSYETPKYSIVLCVSKIILSKNLTLKLYKCTFLKFEKEKAYLTYLINFCKYWRILNRILMMSHIVYAINLYLIYYTSSNNLSEKILLYPSTNPKQATLPIKIFVKFLWFNLFDDSN